MNLRSAFPFVIGLSALALAAYAAEDKKGAPQEAVKRGGLERFKQLAGQWVGKELHGNLESEINVTYKVTSAGSAVVETMFPGTEHEMVTVYHQDGADLVLTHYCALGNQPRMKAERGGDGKTFAFKFAGATNMKSDKEMHMHDATFTFPDNDTIQAEWTHYSDGKAAGTVKFELKRKK